MVKKDLVNQATKSIGGNFTQEMSYIFSSSDGITTYLEYSRSNEICQDLMKFKLVIFKCIKKNNLISLWTPNSKLLVKN